MDINSEWKSSHPQNFWGEIAPCDHVVQIYEDDDRFVDLLTGFVLDGIRADDCVIVIATECHIAQLDQALTAGGADVSGLMGREQYIPLPADSVLSTFMVNGWPDENIFVNVLNGLFAKARAQKRQVRAFGEMVAILWAQGNSGATVHLEHLWNKFAQSHSFSLFCAYPKSGFTGDPKDSIEKICSVHSKLIEGSRSEILYKNLEYQKAG